MKSLKLFPFLFLLAACTGGTPKYDATGTFEATEVIVSAEASGKLLSFDIEEGTTLKDGQEVGIIDTVQLYLKKLQLEASVKSVEGQRPDILKQVAATQEQIVQARRERDRVSNLLRVGAANQKQLDDAESLLEVLRKQLDAQNSTLRNSDRSLTWQSSSVGIQVDRRPVAQMPHHLSADGNRPCPICRSRRTGCSRHPSFQSGGYGADLPPCLHHLRAACRNQAGTASEGLCGLWKGSAERIPRHRYLDFRYVRIHSKNYPDERRACQSGLCRKDCREE